MARTKGQHVEKKKSKTAQVTKAKSVKGGKAAKASSKQSMTTAVGRPVTDDQTSVTAKTTENSGYVMLQDTYLVEKLAHFTRERIPERIVHAKGAGAYGYFEVTDDISKYTCAKFLNKVGKKTPLFIRFSTVGGEKGSADSARDPRGFAIKIYTEDGNYDIVGNNTPIFFIRDAIKFPDFIHTQKRDPQTGLKDATMFWDFLSLTPESVHQVTFLFSDRGTPANFRHMNGFASNTWMFYNDKGETWWFKWHFKTDQGIKNLTAQEAEELAGSDPDHSTRDLFESIEKGDYPSWTAYVQIMTPQQAKKYRFDPFDVTKVLFHKDFPLIRVGRIVLNKNPENFFAEVEQAAFAPSNIVPGIYPSPDKMLQARLFAYNDAHRYRLGVNSEMIPVNQPKGTTVYSNERDGHMNTGRNFGPTANYYPNSVNPYGEADGIPEAPVITFRDAAIARHRVPETDDDDFFQAGEIWRRVLSDYDRDHLISNLAGHMGGALKRIQYRQTALFYKADKEYGTRLSEALDLDVKKVKSLAAMSDQERAAATANGTKW
ncbi:catalase [Methanomassiliicoccus luminyensis]|jgi:catalase|uniref:catalase n=1 Tax=Methanomassiliicoccus luminyensis TaxID=1080712 RepID=UPI0003793691|nr:catalase [Methanomassiliicoccus luminyensis]